MKIELLPIKTRIVHPPKDEIWDIIDNLEVKDGDIIFITSKIVAIHQGHTVSKDKIAKEDLIRQEAERMITYRNPTGNYSVNLTVAHGVLIPAASTRAMRIITTFYGHAILMNSAVKLERAS